MSLHKVYLILIYLLGCIPVMHSEVSINDSYSEIVGTNLGADTENRCALRDRYGFIWIGTTSGLSCFDGNGVPVYRNHSGTLPSTSNLLISTIFENGEDIWFGGNTGLYIFERDKNSIRRFPYKTAYDVTISTVVDKIINVDNNRIWINTQGQGFFIFNRSDSTLVQENRHGSFYSDMTLGANGLIYCASLNGAIQSFRPDGQFVGEILLPDHVFDKAHISIVASGRDIWVTSNENIYKLNISTGEIEHLNPNVDTGSINALLSRRDGTLLMGTNTGIWSYNTIQNSLSRINQSNTLKLLGNESRVISLAPDTDGDVIIIPPTGSLNLMISRVPAFRFIDIPSTSSAYNHIHAVVPTKDGSGMWIGSDNGLAFYNFATGTYSNWNLPQLGHDAVTSLVLNGSKLWIGTRNSGVILYNTATNSSKQYVYEENKPYTVLSNEINNIYHSRRGETFILTNWGVCRYDSVSDNFPQLTDFSQQTRGLIMQEDRHGGLWIATANNGLYYRSAGRDWFENATWCKNIASLQISKLFLDKRGNFWAATHNKGLYKYDEAQKDFISVDIPAIQNSTISYMTDDSDGAMWAGTTLVIAQIDSVGNSQFINLSRFAPHMPLLSTATLLDNGTIIINGRDGFLMFEPSRLKSFDEIIRVYPRSLSFPYIENDNETLEYLGLNTLLYTQDKVSIPYDNNTFTLYTSTACPLVVSGVRYDYMLSGVDKAWNLGTTAPEITYNNLSPGEYKLRLRPHGIANANITELTITILPPWYLTNWAILAYIVLFAALCWGIFVWARRKIRRNFHRRLHDMRIQKEREMFESKTRYFVDLVHEIRTPLMLISLPLERLTNEMQNDVDTVNKSSNMNYIKSMQRNIDYLLGITNQLLDFRKAESNSEIQLHLSRCNLSQMLRTICNRFEEPLTISGKNINLDIPDEDIYIVADADKTERVLMNIVGNAMKYARTNIEISLNDDAQGMIGLSVADDGPGIPHEERERIFDTYYQIGNDNVAASLGTGLGLAYAKLIANAHKGDIYVSESRLGGAMFIITLPLRDDAEIAETTEVVETIDDSPATVGIDNAKNTTILLVEDNADLLTMIKESLSQYYNVITAADGLIALDMLAEHDIDIIVSDVMMPRMDGMELCSHVKNDVNYSHIPFIILTAKTGVEAHEEGLKCGADVYLEKPFPMKQLIYQIGNLLRTRQLFYERMRTSTDTTIIETAEDTPGLNRMDAEFLERMNSIISEAIADEEFSIDGLAEKLSMSRSSFYRKITGVVGMSPSDYLKNFRLNRAVELLRDGCRVTEVADRVGFTSSSYFAKCFRDKFGMLPSDYVVTKKSLKDTENRQ